MFPAVGLITEGALELLSHGPVGRVATGPLDVSLAHLLLEMLLETSFVGKLPGAVWTFERPVCSIVSRLEMVIEESLLSEILIASLTDERPLSGVNPVVDVEMRFSSVGLLTNCAYEGFLA